MNYNLCLLKKSGIIRPCVLTRDFEKTNCTTVNITVKTRGEEEVEPTDENIIDEVK